jgi:hypothetical protein
VIATGFGPQAHRRRRRTTVTEEEPTPRAPEERERFDVGEEVLEVPSFLRE